MKREDPSRRWPEDELPNLFPESNGLTLLLAGLVTVIALAGFAMLVWVLTRV